MKRTELDKKKKELTGLISSELKNSFTQSNIIREYIRDLEKAGYKVDITILTAIAVDETPVKPVLTSAPDLFEPETAKIALTSTDKQFLESLKLTY